MANDTLSNPTLTIDNSAVDIVANSVSYKRGRGEKKVKSQIQSGVATPITTIDSETKVSEVKFKVYNTKASLKKLNTWLAANGSAIELSQPGFDAVPFTNMVLVNDPEIIVGADGDTELMFHGSPVI